jgi:hypothetical protein
MNQGKRWLKIHENINGTMLSKHINIIGTNLFPWGNIMSCGFQKLGKHISRNSKTGGLA